MPLPWEEKYDAAPASAPASERPPWEEGYAAPVGGPSIGPAAPKGLIDQVKDYVANLAFERRAGAAERAEAEAAGIGVTPTAGQMIAGAGIIAAPELVATYGIPATLASVLGGHFGSKLGGAVGERGLEAAVPGAGSLGREGGEVIGGIAGGAVGPRGVGALKGAAARVGEVASRVPPGAAKAVASELPFGKAALKTWEIAKAVRGALPETAPAPSIPGGASSSGGYSFAGVPNLSSVATPKIAPATTRAALEAIPQAGGGELAAVLAREPQLAAQAVATEAAPLAASASPKAVFEAAYKQALTAGKSAPEAATIARAARLQAGQAEQSTLVAKMMGQASEAPRPFVPDYMPGEVGIPLEPSGFAGGLAGLNQVASRFATVPQAAQATAQSLAARYPAFVEQSALLARMLGQ